MSMPDNLVLIRHGQSEGNIATEASKLGDNSFYTPEFTNTLGHQWRLTNTGRKQAQTIGAWINEIFPMFHRYFYSPYIRTQETAAHMNLRDSLWILNRSLREREWGDISNLPRQEFQSEDNFKYNYPRYKTDPLYWTPPGGESIADVAENRVRNVFSTLNREESKRNVIAVTHSEFIKASMMTIERWDDEQFMRNDADKNMRIANCQAIWYTRIDPQTHIRADRLTWVKTATPVLAEDGQWSIVVSDWRHFTRRQMSTQDLLDAVSKVPTLFEK